MVTRFTQRATNRGEFRGIPPTGKRVEIQGTWMHRLAGSKIVEGRQWGVIDMLGLLEQLGATIEPPEQSALAAT